MKDHHRDLDKQTQALCDQCDRMLEVINSITPENAKFFHRQHFLKQIGLFEKGASMYREAAAKLDSVSAAARLKLGTLAA